MTDTRIASPRNVAALYIDPRGPYPKMDGVDAWAEDRDARTYAGDAPIVAHPPCGPWGRLAHMYKGDEHDCAPIAIEQVRRNGGVLEHPAQSRAWKRFGLPLPGSALDAWGGYTIEVQQVEWGHACRKRTWIYLCRTDEPSAPPYPERDPTHWVAGGRGRGKSMLGKSRPSHIKAASSEIARRTPPLFAAWLVALARSAR